MKTLRKASLIMVKNTLLLVLIMTVCSCVSRKYYFLKNDSETQQTVTATYVVPEEDWKEVLTPPDSLLIDTSELPYKPYKWYRKASEKVAYHQLDDFTYQFTLGKNQQAMIPLRYFNVNSLEEVVIEPNQEVLFMDDYDNPFEVYDKKVKAIEVTYQSKLVGESYYLIKIKK